MWQVLIKPAADLIASYFKNKAEEKQALHEQKLNLIQNEADWDKLQAGNSGTSWKDEWFTIVLSVPMIGAFIPGLVPYIREGFIVLDGMPEYYKMFLGAAIAASFGIKALSKWGA